MFYDLIRDPPAPPQPPFWPIAVNLFALVVLGTAVGGWVLYFTDFFPQVLTLLSLGGLLAWLPFLANLLTKESKGELQAKFERCVLLPRKTTVWVLLILVLFFVWWAPLRGSIVVSTLDEDETRTIEIRSRGRDGRWTRVSLQEEHLAPRSVHKYVLPTPWFGSREYRVKLAGLPALKTRVKATRRLSPLSAPDGFFKTPTLLIHLSEKLNVLLVKREEPGKLEVFKDRKSFGRIVPYHGEAVWIGGGEDIEVPERTLTRWRLDLQNAQMPPEMLARWQPYRSVGPNIDLAAGERLMIQVTFFSGSVLRQEVTVAPPYPQEVDIDV